MRHPIVHRLIPSMAIVILASIKAIAPAQQLTGAKAGIIQYMQGKAFLDERPLRLSKGDYVQMGNGQVVRTEQGFVELLLASDSYLRLGSNAELVMKQNRLTDAELDLNRGAAIVEVVEVVKGNRITISIPTGTAEIEKEGLYRLDVNTRGLRVYGGTATAISGLEQVEVKSGREVHFEADGFAPTAFNPNAADALHRWSAWRSFDIYAANPSSRGQTHWQPIAPGWMRNAYYRMKLYSTVFLDEWNENQQRLMDAIDNAAEAQRRAKRETETRRRSGN